MLLSVVIVVVVVGGAIGLRPPRSPPTAAQTQSGALRAAPAAAVPRLVDLGSTTCAPCKVMLGVMSELEERYPGAMAIEFINVNENPELADRYGVRVIPTQIFYAPDQRELFRHVGVFRTEEIVAKWKDLGFPIALAQR